MTEHVDSYRFLDALSRQLVASWIRLNDPQPIPWTPLAKPLAECTVALISSGGIFLKTDKPYDLWDERRNPWWGDPSYRVIPRGTTAEDVRIFHLHINPAFVEQDINCLLPLQRLAEMESRGEIGHCAESHYSYMGYILQPETLLEQSVPAIIERLKQEHVDIVMLIPVGSVCCWSAGLVQRRIEAAGFSTITLSFIPDLTASAGVPRLAGIEHPGGMSLGIPGDVEGQTAVLRATLQAVETMTEPGSIVDLPFDWPEEVREKFYIYPPQNSPIRAYLMHHRDMYGNLLRREVPEGEVNPPDTQATPDYPSARNLGDSGR